MATKNSALDELLDSSIDDLADLPESKPYPAGAHRCTISFEEKVINKKPAVEVKLKGISTEELADDSDAPISPGQETQVLYILKNDDGSKNEISQGQLKNLLNTFKTAMNLEGSLREIMEASSGTEIIAVTKKREDKKNEGTFRTNIVSVAVV